MAKREEFTAHATKSLVQIYGKMKPDAAAAQLMAMDEFVAAAIMSKLSTKDASLIMAEMEAAKAATAFGGYRRCRRNRHEAGAQGE